MIDSKTRLKPSGDIAIVGMAFRLPGDIRDDAELWAALLEQRDLVSRVPAERWAVDELQHPRRGEPGRSITFAAGVLKNVDQFDAAFFGISPREAAWMDPQQRLLLQLAWEALENAGWPSDRVRGSDCAVYIGISSLDYGTRGLDDLASMSSHSMTGNALSIAANRLSYVFDLHGPSVAIDTACSSSLVALHHACRALQAGEASCALVGGVNLLLHPYPFVGFSKASMLSEEGRCKTFDASADGYVRSEGGAVIILKPLEQAIADGDRIRAVIVGSGVNADGARKSGLTIPSRQGQVDLMYSVLERSGLVGPDDVDYIEAHGTGTSVGDPVECSAIASVYGRGRAKPLLIGSVKSNLGHMEAASGMAGLVKAVLILENRTVPPQRHLGERNPDIDFDGGNLRPVTEVVPIEKDGPVVVGVNSFGFGGANAHVLLKEYRPFVDPSHGSSRGEHGRRELPLFISARSAAALRRLALAHANALNGARPEDWYDYAYSVAYCRDRLESRLAVLASSCEEAASALRAFVAGDQPARLVAEDALPESGGVAFVYSGNGAQWPGMAKSLLQECPRFAEYLADVDDRLRKVAGLPVLQLIRESVDADCLADTAIAQPLLFAIQVALTRLLRDLGVFPQAVAGHSVGEVAAAWAAGALDLEAAVAVIVARSRAQAKTRGSGRMAAVGLSAAEVQALLDADPLTYSDLVIAGINDPGSVTVSGSLQALQVLENAVGHRCSFFRLLDLDYAFHSPHMEPIRADLLSSLEGLKPGSGKGPTFVSTVTGGPLCGSQLDATYWWRNVREPVRFQAAVQALLDSGCRVMLEIGPHAILQHYMRECMRAAGVRGRVLPLLRKGHDGYDDVVASALRAQLLVVRPALEAHFPVAGRVVPLPNYPWECERHWHPRSSESLLTIERRRVHPLLGWMVPEAPLTWENILDPVGCAWLADHKVGGAVVFPAAGYVDMALAAARQWRGGDAAVVEQLDILAPLVFDGEVARQVRFEIDERDGSFFVRSRRRLSTDPWTLHAAGRLLQPAWPEAPTERDERRIERAPDVQTDAHYALAERMGLEYGPAFRGLKSCWIAGAELVAHVEAPAALDHEHHEVHPALLDVCFQAVLDFFAQDIQSGRGRPFLPIKVSRLERYRSGSVARFTARFIRQTSRSVVVDFEIFDTEGCLLMRLSGCRYRAAPFAVGKQTPSRWSLTVRHRPHPAVERSSPLPPLAELTGFLESSLQSMASRRRGWFSETLPLQEALVVSFAYEAWRTLEADGCQAWPDPHGTHPYWRWLADVLRDEGLLERVEDGWLLRAAADLPPASRLWRTLLHEHPSCWPSLVLIGRVGSRLSRAQRDAQACSQPAFQPDSAAIDSLLDEDPAYAGVGEALKGLLGRMAESLAPGRRLRVLEISAWPSDLARALPERLRSGRLTYVQVLPEVMAERLPRDGDLEDLAIVGMDPVQWTWASESVVAQRYDLIILRHILHRAAQPARALEALRGCLAPGGAIVIAERHPDLAANFVHGLEPDWWRDAPVAPQPESPLHAPSAWLGLLERAGFEGARVVSEPAAGDLPVGAYLVVAGSPDAETVDGRTYTPQSWHLIVDTASESLAQGVVARLRHAGQQVDVVGALDAWRLQGPDHLVFLLGWEASIERVGDGLADILGALRSLSLAPGVKQPAVWFVTRGAVVADEAGADGAPANPAQAALGGMVRVWMNENPGVKCTLIDLRLDVADPGVVEQLARELLEPDGANEIVIRPQGRYVPMVCPEEDRSRLTDGTEERFRLDFVLAGQLRNLAWLAMPSVELGDDEVEVEVRAVGLNFRDVMYVMGLLPDEAVEQGFAGPTLGLEFAGVVTRIGRNVHDLGIGMRVMGFGSACFASHVVTPASAVAPIPESWTFESAATVPTAFFTAYYALRHLAGLEAGERVLIHGAAGGVGMAAIQLARHFGAEVFATAGSPDKRDVVALLGADHVLDSRSLSFADQIMAVTGGRGVDVVLNSLAGEAMRRSLAVLRPFGRFLELGKRDFFENTPIGLRPLKDNISYFAIDADQLLVAKPRLAQRLFGELMGLFRTGVLAPLPCRVFSADRVVDAFRTMQQSRHIGKVVVSMTQGRPTVSPPHLGHEPLQLSSDATWLVTGGLSGLGFEVARWLVGHGVRHLVLVSRSGVVSPAAAEALEAMHAQGAQVTVQACDVGDAQALRRLMEGMRTTMPPLKGIVHAAAVYDDALLVNLDAARLRAVLAPKLLGAWNLHQASLDVALDHFVLFSSVASLIANPGQANYVAANAGIEALAALRRRLGLPATCIAWGPIGDTGYLARQGDVRDALSKRLGRPPLSTRQVLEQLEQMLAAEAPVVRTVADFEWPVLARLLPTADSPRYDWLNRHGRSGSADAEVADLRQAVQGKSLREALPLVQSRVIQELAKVLAMAPERIDPARSLHDLGMDSLMAVELAVGLEQALGVQLPPMALSEEPTVERVALRLTHRLLGLTETNDNDAEGVGMLTLMASQHGESLDPEEAAELARRAEALAQQSTRLTA